MNTFDSTRINSFRGLACALLVAHHITLSLVDYRQLEAVTAQDIDRALSYFRMPAFAFVSGLILGITKSDIGNSSFVFKKMERLIIPFLFVTVVSIIGRMAARGDVDWSDVPYFWIYPYSHMWFLPAVFIFFMMSAAFSLLCDLRSTKGAAIFLFAAFAISISPLPPELPFAINPGAELFPFFALGLLFANRKRGASTIQVYAIIAAAICFVTIIQLAYGADNPWRNIIQSAVVLVGFAVMPCIGILAYLGRYSFTVYLFHSIIISIGIRAMPGQPLTAALGIFFAAILFSILIEVGFRRYTPSILPMIGQKKPQPSPSSPRH